MKSIIKKAAKTKKSTRVFMFIFFTIFACVGGGMLYPFGIKPIKKTLDAKTWTETPCKIVSAKVKTHSGSDSTTYSIEIEYEYQFNERSYRNDEYSFTGGSSSGRKNKSKVVSQYKNAANPICYVNPGNPSEAILKRGFHLGLLFALFPLPFLAVGVGGLYWVVFRYGKNKSYTSKTQWSPTSQSKENNTTDFTDNPYEIDSVRDFTATESGMIEIKSTSPVKALLGAIAIAAFWNGIVSIFVVQVIKDFQWFMALFLTPFVLIGLFIIGYAVMRFLMLFNPRPRVMLSAANVKPGNNLKMKWELTGRTRIIRKLSITLRAIEKATYRRGTNTRTDTNTFFQTEIMSTDDSFKIPFGEINFAIPEGVMHSFDAPNNKIVWELALDGDIKSWPDIDETYSITVLP